VGGISLGRWYPELEDSMLLCATEMSKRADMDVVKSALVRVPEAAQVR
jgi:glycine dehydrogenase subunit 1